MEQWDIVIKEFKKHNHKQVVVNNRVMMTYTKVPKLISFKNQMINDMNQNLCGGWSIFDNGIEENEILLNRILNKEKPFGSIGFWKENINKTKKFIEIIKENGGLSYQFTSEPNDSWDRILVCQNGIMNNLFDLDCLREDYSNNGIIIDIEKVRNKQLREYFNGWDRYKNNVQPWETGLILGYPVENTISLYLEGMV